MAKASKSTDPKQNQNVVENPNNDKAPNKFEERWDLFMNGLSTACEDNKVPTAVAIVVDPKSELPIVFATGHIYEQAALLAMVLRKLKADMAKDLNV